MAVLDLLESGNQLSTFIPILGLVAFSLKICEFSFRTMLIIFVGMVLQNENMFNIIYQEI